MSKICIDYFTPKIEVHTIAVEHGFALSNMESIEAEHPEQYW